MAYTCAVVPCSMCVRVRTRLIDRAIQEFVCRVCTGCGGAIAGVVCVCVCVCMCVCESLITMGLRALCMARRGSLFVLAVDHVVRACVCVCVSVVVLVASVVSAVPVRAWLLRHVGGGVCV